MNTNTKISDEELVKKVRDYQDSYSLVELQQRHGGIVIDVARKFGAMQTGNHMADLKDEVPYIIFKAAESFKEEFGIKFNTWVGNKTKYYCFKKIKEESKYVRSSTEETNNYLDNYYDLDKELANQIREEASYIREIASYLKDKRILKMLDLRYFSGDDNMTFSEIGEVLDLTHQGVIDLHTSFMSFIKTKLLSKNITDVV